MLSKRKKQSFVQGAFILMLANVLVKGIGALFKIPLINLIGDTGNGIFTVAYNIYTFMYIVSSAGLPVAVSRMVSEANALGKHRQTAKIARIALVAFVVLGSVMTLAVLFAVGVFGISVASSAKYATMAIAPAIFFTCVISAIRGYFQGMANMVPTAISQIIESVCKLVFGLLFAYYLSFRGFAIEIVVAGAIGGVTVGTVISAIYVVIARIKDIRNSPPVEDYGESLADDISSKTLLQKLVNLAIPITIGASVLSLTNLIDSFVVLSRLQESVGMTQEAAVSLYGVYSMAVTLFNIPPALITGVGISIIPAIASALALKNRERAVRLTETAFRFTALLTLPCAFGMFVVANPTLNLLYYKQPESVITATPLLKLLTPAMFFVSMVTVTNAILQAAGKERAPVKSMLVGGAVKLITNYILVGIITVNIHGAPIGTTLCYGVITAINLIMIKKEGLNFSFAKVFVKPFVCSAVMGVFAWLILGPLSSAAGPKIGLVLTVFLAVIFYVGMLIITRAVPKEDLAMLPFGDKIVKKLEKQ